MRRSISIYNIPKEPKKHSANMSKAPQLTFYLNNERHVVNINDVDPSTTLNSYLRSSRHLTGTKKMCVEGGCGACVVAIRRRDPHTGKHEILAVNSCLVSVYSCLNWTISSVEDIGSQDSPHAIQKVLADFNGTQCGYCSPGMVMNMYALSESKNLTMKEVENSFGGNICRCTGYRPILSAFKSMCQDACKDLLGTYPDIEDLTKCKQVCTKIPDLQPLETIFYIRGRSAWLKVFLFNDLIMHVRNFHHQNRRPSYKLIAGNTARGVYKNPLDVDIYVDICDVKELVAVEANEDELKIGANITLTNAMSLFNELATKYKKFQYLKGMADHIDLIANVPVRNIGTFGGNLMMKHENHDFPSDIYLILETVGATFEIVDINRMDYIETAQSFLYMDMSDKVLKTIILQGYDGTFKYDSFKIMPRAQNAHALVNAGFLLEISPNSIVKSARITFGNINSKFNRATQTEQFITEKNLFDNNILQQALEILNSEIHPQYVIAEPKPEFRRKLCLSLFYKYILRIAPDSLVDKRNLTGRIKFDRPVSTGTQDYETNESLYPLTQAIPKLEALAQTTGEAEYIGDMPDWPNQLFATFVLANAPPNYVIQKIDTTKALAVKGVVTFMDKNDIPGRNTFTPKEAGCMGDDEEIFCSGKVQYCNQPVGIIVAQTQEIANKAAGMVEIIYKSSDVKPLLTPRDIMKANAKHKIFPDRNIVPKSKGKNVKHVFKGTFDMGWQYHFHMETQCCNAVPTEDSLDLYPGTQWIDLCQTAASVALNIPSNKINASVRRVGGAFGGKIVRASIVSTACALAAHKLKKPVKMWLTIEDNIAIIGKRFPLSADYEIAIDDEGVIQYLKGCIYYDYGCGTNEPVMFVVLETFENQYNKDVVDLTGYTTRSDMHAGCYCRAPGSAESVALLESIIEHVACEQGFDPVELRLKNVKDELMAKYLQDHRQWADVDARIKAVQDYNKENMWRKRGLSVAPMIFPMDLFFQYNALITIYQADGSVALSHGGVEIGQGINTKAAQVCAYKLGIPLSKVCVKPSNTLANPNNPCTGASLTSENVCLAIIKACDVLLARLKPFRDETPNAAWEEIVKKAHAANVDLSASAIGSKDYPDIGPYKIYGVCSAEIELDVLTGQYQILRVDLLEDVGTTLSPEVDIGQIEGAFIMGLGLFLTEQLVVDENGKIVTDRTWNYKPPGVKDIPLDFRVKFPKNNPNKMGVLKSKATGEPSLCLSVCVPLAIRQAVASIRQEIDKNMAKWYPIDGPSTVEQTFSNCLHDYKHYKL